MKCFQFSTLIFFKAELKTVLNQIEKFQRTALSFQLRIFSIQNWVWKGLNKCVFKHIGARCLYLLVPVTSQCVSRVESRGDFVSAYRCQVPGPCRNQKSMCVKRSVEPPWGVLHPCQPISVLPVCQRTNQRPFLPTAEWFYFRQPRVGFVAGQQAE